MKNKLFFVTTEQDNRVHGYFFTLKSAEAECRDRRGEPFSREIYEVEDTDTLTDAYADIGTSAEKAAAFLKTLKAGGELIAHNA